MFTKTFQVRPLNMPHIVHHPHPPFLSSCKTLLVHQIPAATDNLIWLIEYKKGYVAAVDGPSAKEVLAYCAEHNLILDTIINTHTHGDHIGINLDLKKRGVLSQMRVIGAASRAADIPGITETVRDDDRIQLGSVTGQAMRTDGHINGHISYLFSDLLFCGDTLFTGGCGYLFDGPPKTMYESLKRLRALPQNTKVCCAHEYTQDNLLFARSMEPNNHALERRLDECIRIRKKGGTLVPSTLALECATNPFLRWDKEELFRTLQQENPLLKSNQEAEIFTATRRRKDSKKYRS
jgi:hydroxyacylglutathione hydrolase